MVQKEGTQICISEWSQGLTLAQNVDWGFLLSTTFPKIAMFSGSKKEPRYTTFPSKNPGKWIPSRFPIVVPMDRNTRLQDIVTSHLIYLFYLSLRVPGKGAPSMFPNRVTTDRDTPSPEPLAYLSCINSFIHVCLPESPKRSPSTYIWGKTYTTLKTPCSFNKFPDGPYASGSKKGTRIYFHFSQKSWQTNPLQVP